MRFQRFGFLVSLGFGCFVAGSGVAAQQPVPERPGAVILMIGDGMGFQHIAFARYLLLPRGERFHFESFPVTGLVSTWSASNATTDSGAAATAMASGVKTLNRMIGMDPSEQPLETIADRAKAAGWRIGYVTTTSITHATPASFYASVEDRYADTAGIALQLLEQGPDVALGGGTDDFLPEGLGGKRKDGRNLVAEAQAAGYAVWQSRRELPAAPLEQAPGKVLGLFAPNHLDYELDLDDVTPETRHPHLTELTRTALDLLGRDGRPFFLMLEGGRIDHAAHSFDAAGVVAEIAAFDAAVQAVLEFRRERPDVLVLLTADHSTGGLALNDFVDWGSIGDQLASIEVIVDRVRDKAHPAPLEEVQRLAGYVGIAPGDFADVFSHPDKNEARRALGRALSRENGVTWIPRIDPFDTKGHTGEDVPIYALGPGSSRFGGALDNTEIATRLLDLLGWPRISPAPAP